MDRRALLLLAGSALTGLAGCTGRDNPLPRVAYVWLVNDSDRTREVSVTIEAGDETAFEKTYTLAAEGETSNVSDDSPVDGPGEYTFRAETDGETITADTTRLVDAETDEYCVGLKVLIDTAGRAHFEPDSMQRCGGGSPE